jgi:hypothetical protein
MTESRLLACTKNIIYFEFEVFSDRAYAYSICRTRVFPSISINLKSENKASQQIIWHNGTFWGHSTVFIVAGINPMVTISYSARSMTYA